MIENSHKPDSVH